jgi:hypothetical protein
VILDYDDPRLASPAKYFNATSLHFVVVGTNNIAGQRPKISMSAFKDFNVTITGHGLHRAEYIVLQPGDAADNTQWFFATIDIQLVTGRYGFDVLRCSRVHFLSAAKRTHSQISQRHLITDFESFARIPDLVDHIGPTHSFRVTLNGSVDRLTFRGDHSVVASVRSRTAVFDLLQLPTRETSAVLDLTSRRVDLSFAPRPNSLDDLPNITFHCRRSARFFWNTTQFPDPVMDLSGLWTFNHLSQSLYFESPPNVRPPTVTTTGMGVVLTNNQTVAYSSKYCLCDKACDDCTDTIVPFAKIDQTVIGNPSKVLHYTIRHSSATHYPRFNTEHFGDRTLTVVGKGPNEHAGVTSYHVGDTHDDEDDGVHSFQGITVHFSGPVKFPMVDFAEVRFACRRNCSLNSTHLAIDFAVLNASSHVHFVPPLKGWDIHTNNFLDFVNVTLVSAQQILLNGRPLVSNPVTRPEVVIRVSSHVNLRLGPLLRKSPGIESVPRVRIIVDSATNSILCSGEQWPEALNDTTAKIIIDHGSSPLHVTGEPKDKDYSTVPPVIAHSGTGPVYFNGILSNFYSSYCVCEGFCEDSCGDVRPIIDYNASSIADTIRGNPNRVVEYFVHGTTNRRRPVFPLHDFRGRSFTVSGSADHREYVTVEGARDIVAFPPSSVSHAFQNIDVRFAGPGYYLFNNAVLRGVRIGRTASVGDSYHVMQRGMTADVGSLYELSRRGLLFPSTLYMHVTSGAEALRIGIAGPTDIALAGESIEPIRIDTSRLSTPLTVSVGRATKDVPLVVEWLIKDARVPLSDAPQLRIDVSEMDDAYIVFRGRRWVREYHNLSDLITVIHGQANIHVEDAKDSSGNYVGQPPHVQLIGDGDYYVNGRKQSSRFAEGNHLGDAVGGETDQVWWIKVGLFVVLSVVAFALILSFEPMRPAKVRKVPRAEAHHRDPDSPQFPVVDQEDGATVQTT